MGLELLWDRLNSVALPFAVSITIASLLALPLGQAAERTGLPRRRERCIGCRAEGELIARGACPEVCAVNDGATLPLLLFVAAATTAIFAYADPGAIQAYVLPYGIAGTALGAFAAATIVGASSVAAVLLAAYFAQDWATHLDLWTRGAALGALFGFVGLAVPAAPVHRWVDLALPVALVALLFAAAITWRARHGRPAFGLRSIALAALPLFALTLFGAIRILQLLALAGG